MQTITDTPSQLSVVGLVRNLGSEVKTFIRQEIQLVKREIAEKISHLGKNATKLAIGGFMAYAGLIVLLIGLGALAAWGLKAAGLDAGLAGALGVGVVGLLVVAIGGVIVLNAVKALSTESLKPERTLQTLQELKSAPQPDAGSEPQDKAKPSSEELQARVNVTEDLMTDTLSELGHRLSPSHLNAQLKTHIRQKPYRYGVVAMILGVLSGQLIKRRFQRA